MKKHTEFLMGNEAIARGAVHAGIRFASGYPGTPSTEILETVAKCNDGGFYVEWSVNEKVALEVAAGASYAGARSLVTMKQVGLNVASDPLMSLAYVGIKGGMVIVVADDPGPISSQTEQDTRTFAMFAKLPVFDPSTPEEAYEMMIDAFAYSEKYGTPVLFRPTTRVCHSCASVEVFDEKVPLAAPEGFVKDTMRWVIFPRTSYLNHLKIEQRNPEISEDFSSYRFNWAEGTGTHGVVSGGVSCTYIEEAVQALGISPKRMKIATPFPFPEKAALAFLDGLEDVTVIEELDPVIERALIHLSGKYHLPLTVHGKLDGTVQQAGENSVESVKSVLAKFFGIAMPKIELPDKPPLPVRPPVLCAGCPHRASFYAVKQAAKGKKAVFSGDIGCYTLGNAMPLDMVDTCLCMGAGVTIAQGLHRIEPDTVNFAFIGDSTFFASGLTGVVNAVYNGTDIVLIVLDNATTAMTGHQPHPGTGMTIMNSPAEKMNVEKVLEGIGITSIRAVNPLHLDEAVSAVTQAMSECGVRAVIFRSPCIAVTKPQRQYTVSADLCTGCQMCIRELGCPAVVTDGKKVKIELSLCYGCSLCAQVCKFGAIQEVQN